MFKKIALAAVAVSALAVGAPVAHAAAVTADCGFNTVAQETATGGQDTFTGVAYCYAAADTAGASISVHGEVRVNGSTVASTDAGVSAQVSTSAGQVTYTASDTDTVTLCAVWTGSESGEVCGGTTTQQIPPQEVIDLLDQINTIIADATAGTDPLVCGLLKTAGVPAVANALAPTVSMDADDCDLYLQGERLIDFVPYED